MVHLSLAVLCILSAVIVAVNCSCYNYYTASTCSGQTCPGGGKCYWVFNLHKKRSADGIPALESDNEQLNNEEVGEAVDREKRVFNPDDPYPDPDGYCDCCTLTCNPPKILTPRCKCVCPYKACSGGRIQNQQTCNCECPPNSYWDSTLNNCVGDCKWLSSAVCSKVRCNLNKHLSCIASGSSCRCPTCSDYYYNHSSCLGLKCAATGYQCKWKYHYSYYYYYCSCY